LLIALILTGSSAAQVTSSQQQKKSAQSQTPKPAIQSGSTTNQPKPQPATSAAKPQPATNAPKPQTQTLVTTQKTQSTSTAQGSATKSPAAPSIQPITSTSHPQSTISVAPAVPQALPKPVSRTSNGLPANIPNTTIGPVSPAAQQSALLGQLKQALRVQRFHQDKLYYTIVCGPGTVCPQPSFNPNQAIPSPNDGLATEQYTYLIQIENQIDQQAQQIMNKQGAAGAQNKINEIRRQYDPIYR